MTNPIPTPENLAERIRAHCQTEGISPTRFGIDVAKDPNLVRDLANGRNVGLRLLGRISLSLQETPATDQAKTQPPPQTGEKPCR